MRRTREVYRTLHNLTPAELSAFVAVAKHGGFRAASRALGASPSALSHGVAGLEARLNVQLFRRTTRSISLTDAGARFAEALAPALAQFDQALATLDDYAKQPSGLIRINAASGATELVLAPLVVRFLAAYPDMHVEITSESRLIDIVRDGFDCGIRARHLVPAEMIAVPIGPPLQHIVVGSPSYLAAAPPLVSPADLPQHQCLQLRLHSGHHYRWEFVSKSEAFSVDTSGRLTLDNSHHIRAAALAGFGLGYVSSSIVEADISDGSLIHVLRDWTPPYPGLCLYYPRHRHLSAGMRALIESARRGESL